MIHKLYLCYTVKRVMPYEILKFLTFFSLLAKNIININ